MITYSTVADVPQSGDLDLVAGRQCGGIDDPQFPVDVGPRTQKRVVVSSARASPRVVDGGRQLGDVRDDPGALVSGALSGVADSDQAHDQVRHQAFVTACSPPPRILHR
jgi:hypothetical protein